MPDPAQVLRAAEERLFALHALPYDCRMVELRDPALQVAVRFAGEGAPLLLVHGSGMCAATWAPLMEHLPGRRLIAVDLPGFGLSDRHSYAGRSLRRHAVAQLTSILDALDIASATLAGTSLGAMWSLCLAVDAPERVDGLVALGVPAVCLPGMKGDTYFRLMTTPVLGSIVARAPKPKTVAQVRRAMRDVLGDQAIAATSDEFFEVVRAGMTAPGWSESMRTHLTLAMRRGRPRPENFLTDRELAGISSRVDFIWGASDVYGPPSIGERAAAVMPDARLHVLPGGHAPFLDDPQRCGRITLTGSD